MHKQVKQEMEMDEVNYAPFQECVVNKDIDGMQLYLKHVSPFNSHPELLTEQNINALLLLFLDDQSHANHLALKDQIDDMKLSQSQRDVEQNATIKNDSEESSQTQSQVAENDSSRFKFGVGTLGAIVAFIVSSAWGIYVHPMDRVVVINFIYVFVIALGFGVGEFDHFSKEDTKEQKKRKARFWRIQQLFNQVAFGVLSVVSAILRIGRLSDLGALMLYCLVYLLCAMIFILICYKIDIIGNCHGLRK